MSRRLARAVSPVLILLLSGSVGDAQTDPPTGGNAPPLGSALVERTERRLIQLDVSLFPKKKRRDALIPALDLDDLELVINGSRIDVRYLDRLCSAVESEPAPRANVAPPALETPETTPAVTSTGRGAYLFYFEHKHLTMKGQEQALAMAEKLIPQLVDGGARGMIVSSGQRLLQSKLTDDADRLLEFLEEVRGDVGQWGEIAYAEGESDRYADIFNQQFVTTANVPTPKRSRGGEGISFAINRGMKRALFYAREERMVTSRQLRRLAAVLGSFAELDPPKATLYFADIIRKNPGRHYAALFSDPTKSMERETMIGPIGMISNMAWVAGLTFDRVTEQAAAQGIRLYTIRARGLELAVSTVTRSPRARPNQMTMPDRGARDAEETMVALALESGGASFLGGTDSSTMKRVLDRIRSDLSCFYLLSFYPGELPEDALLPVRVRFNVDSPRFAELDQRWEVRSRGQLVVQSEAKRKESILLAAHAAPSAVESETGRTVLIPLGYEDDQYQVLAQFSVESPELPAALSPSTSWDLGMSLVFKEKVRHQVARRFEVDTDGVPVVLEAAWSFPPGPGEVVSVGYEQRFGQLASVGVETDWPDPDGPAASISPIAVVQPASGVFLRVDSSGGERHRGEGSLAVGDGPAHLDRPIYFIGLVCRGKRNRDLWIDRKLVGNVSVDFGLQGWHGDAEQRCVQIRDLILPDQVGWGDFRYVVRVYADPSLEEEPLAEQVREFTGV